MQPERLLSSTHACTHYDTSVHVHVYMCMYMYIKKSRLLYMYILKMYHSIIVDGSTVEPPIKARHVLISVDQLT